LAKYSKPKVSTGVKDEAAKRKLLASARRKEIAESLEQLKIAQAELKSISVTLISEKDRLEEAKREQERAEHNKAELQAKQRAEIDIYLKRLQNAREANAAELAAKKLQVDKDNQLQHQAERFEREELQREVEELQQMLHSHRRSHSNRLADLKNGQADELQRQRLNLEQEFLQRGLAAKEKMERQYREAVNIHHHSLQQRATAEKVALQSLHSSYEASLKDTRAHTSSIMLPTQDCVVRKLLDNAVQAYQASQARLEKEKQRHRDQKKQLVESHVLKRGLQRQLQTKQKIRGYVRTLEKCVMRLQERLEYLQQQQYDLRAANEACTEEKNMLFYSFDLALQKLNESTAVTAAPDLNQMTVSAALGSNLV